MTRTNKIHRAIRSTLAVAAMAALVTTGVAPAAAASTEATDSSGAGVVQIGRMVAGEFVAITEEEIQSATATLPAPPSASDSVTPKLIDWNQWYGCFTLNHSDDVFAEYNHYWDGIGQDVRLKCGEGTVDNPDSGWGYKHIRAKHETQWQSVLNAARQAGWVSESQGVESWDDLMAAAAGEAITWPEFKGGNSISQTSCGVTEVFFWNIQTGQPVYSFRARAGWSNTNDRLITAFPQPNVNC